MDVSSTLLDPFFRRLSARDEISPEERAALLAAAGREASFSAGQDIVRDRQRVHQSTLVVSGVASRYELLSDGRRQIVALHLPGDFVDLHSLLLKTMDHGVGALSECHVVTFDHDALREMTRLFPHLTRVLWLMTLLDAAIMREGLVSIGRRSALERVAHLFCELSLRLEVIGMKRGSRMDLPLTQVVLADVLGLSTVHINRMVQELRGRNLLIWEGTSITLPDFDRLAGLAQFDPRYLHLNREPR